MKNKLILLLEYIQDRLLEPSTYQGMAFLLTLAGSRYANLNWGEATSIGAGISAILKILLKD